MPKKSTKKKYTKASKRGAKRKTKKAARVKKKTKSVEKTQVKKKRRQSRRSLYQFPLVAGLISKVKKDFIDIDYFSKLNLKELEFLEAYLAEEVNGDVNHKFKKLNKMTAQRKKELWGANNSKNRDAFAVARASGALEFSGGPGESANLNPAAIEDALIEYIDSKRVKPE